MSCHLVVAERLVPLLEIFQFLSDGVVEEDVSLRGQVGCAKHFLHLPDVRRVGRGPDSRQRKVIALVIRIPVQQPTVDRHCRVHLPDENAARGEVCLDRIDARLQLVGFLVQGPAAIRQPGVRVDGSRHIQISGTSVQFGFVLPKESDRLAELPRSETLTGKFYRRVVAPAVEPERPGK